jgi:hypothetical protein
MSDRQVQLVRRLRLPCTLYMWRKCENHGLDGGIPGLRHLSSLSRTGVKDSRGYRLRHPRLFLSCRVL